MRIRGCPDAETALWCILGPIERTCAPPRGCEAHEIAASATKGSRFVLSRPEISRAMSPSYRSDQLSLIRPPSTVTLYSGNGLGAGPPCTEPSWMENVEEWHGQVMDSSRTLTEQPW